MADAQDNTIVLTYKYRLLPSKRQHQVLESILAEQRYLYNAALEHRIGAYTKAAKNITLYEQQRELTELRVDSQYSAISRAIQHWTLERLDEAYAGFFRRVKAKGEKAGFPRFRTGGRWRTFGFSRFSGISLREGRIRFKGLPGSIRIKRHRPLPDGKPLCCTFTRNSKGWYIGLQYRISCVPLPEAGQQIGIDMGLTTLAMLSTGEAIGNPRHTKRSERALRKRQRAMARCNLASNRRRKMKAKVTKLHTKIANGRRTHLHQVSAKLVREYDLIAVEKLNVKGLAAGMLSKGVNDAGWTILKRMIAYKAEKAGREFITVKAEGTSQTCPKCGHVEKKTLSQRTHRCDCGCVLDRDHAAAIIVLQRALTGARNAQLKAVA